MKKVLYFHFKGCPYCAQADRWLEELLREDARFAALEIERIDEKLEPGRADQYDYYYVPTFFVDGVKVHEGAATKEKVRAALEKALEA